MLNRALPDIVSRRRGKAGRTVLGKPGPGLGAKQAADTFAAQWDASPHRRVLLTINECTLRNGPSGLTITSGKSGGENQLSRRPEAIGIRAARIAGRMPPSKPISDERRMALNSSPGVTAKAKAIWLHVWKFMVAAPYPSKAT